jgi:hypothetical protein
LLLPQPASYAYPPEPKPRRPLLTGTNAFWAFFLLLGLATIGVSGWGLAESIKVTNYTVSGFWDIVAEAQDKVRRPAAATACCCDSLLLRQPAAAAPASRAVRSACLLPPQRQSLAAPSRQPATKPDPPSSVGTSSDP